MSSLSQFFGDNKLPLGIKDTAFYIDALIVGGGGGSFNFGSGLTGSGGGRVLQALNLLVERNVTYNVTVGQAGGTNQNGQNSVFGSLIAQGGGVGNNRTGGSGGGVASANIIQPLFPTVGTYSVNDILNATNIISSGNAGGSGSSLASGGGGGAGSVGRDYPIGTIGPGGTGGDGLLSTIKGPGPYYYGAGTGGQSVYSPAINNGFGAGGANTGTGGQSGVVVIAYPNTLPLATTTGSPTLFTGGTATRTGYHVYEFTGSGSITFN
jgi:hypothetical protein